MSKKSRSQRIVLEFIVEEAHADIKILKFDDRRSTEIVRMPIRMTCD